MNPKLLRTYLRVIAISFEMTLRNNVTDAFFLFGILVQPLLVAMIAFWILQDKGGDYAIFVVVGSGMSGMWTAVLFESGNSITRERWTGTLESMIASPTPAGVVVFGRNLAITIQSLASMVLSFGLAILVFDVVPVVEEPAYFVISLIFGLASYIFFGLIIAPAFVLNPDVQRLQNGLEFPVYILAGFLFPIALLPVWTTPLSYILSPYWAALALHGSASGDASLDQLAFFWAMLVILSAIYLIISRRFLKAMVRKARADATLNMQ
ncbi:MAG: ABC transporter permease [Anaerolineales bacterium]|nr:ABC transporter permease [Anaerolineales bacterium]